MSEYDHDFAAWAAHQARFVAEGRWDELDRENVAEELRSIARQEKGEARRLVYWIMRELAYWYLRPELRCGRWSSRILTRRFRLRRLLRDSPSIDAVTLW